MIIDSLPFWFYSAFISALKQHLWFFLTSAHWALYLCVPLFEKVTHTMDLIKICVFVLHRLLSCVSPVALFPILFYCKFSGVFLIFGVYPSVFSPQCSYFGLWMFASVPLFMIPSYWFSSCCLYNIPGRTAHWSLKECPVNNVLLSRRYAVLWWDNISMYKEPFS